MTRTMMMTTIRKTGILFIALIISISLSAQDKDFGIWYGANLNKGITNKLALDVSAMIRTFQKASKVEQGFLEAGLGYKINKHLDAALSYRLTSAFENDSKYHFQHKAFLDLKGDVKVSDFSFSGRFRFQTRLKTYLVYVTDKYPDYTGRIKLKAMYRTPSFPLNPYIYCESFCPMFAKSDRVVGKNRFSAGVVYKISKAHSVDIGYIFQRDYLPKLSDMNIISLEYSLKL
jgi:long-subunit fatty acid transport protein